MNRNRNETAERYADVWRRGTYAGFSRDTQGARATPFLDAFVAEVRALGASEPRLLELGAGSFDHALRLAREGFRITAVEYSAVAVADARRRSRSEPGLPLEILQADLFAHTAQLPRGRLNGVYANAVFHFLSADERRTQYRALRGALAERGVLAISFKAGGDALERRGRVVEQTAAGPIVEGDDGIRRLFVSATEALAEEMREEGYVEPRVIRWSVAGYNVSNESGEFVGILARASGH